MWIGKDGGSSTMSISLEYVPGGNETSETRKIE